MEQIMEEKLEALSVNYLESTTKEVFPSQMEAMDIFTLKSNQKDL
jgi:hypothetical protein